MPTFKGEHIFFPKADRTCHVFLEEIHPHIYHSSYSIEGFPFARRLDWYAVVEPGKHALFIDTGSWELIGTDTLDAAVEQLNLDWQQVEIFMTHFHVDHEESLQYCLARGARTVYCGPQNAISKKIIDHWGHVTGSVRAGDQAVVDVVISVATRLSETSIPHREIVLSENDYLEIAGYQFRPIYTPGHTAEHVILFETNERFIFGGDHIIESSPGIMQWVENDHMLRRYLETFPRIRAMRPQGVYMSHHEPFTSEAEVDACIENIIDSYTKPLSKTLATLTEAGRPMTSYEVACRHYDYRPEGLMSFNDDMRCRRVANSFGYLEYLFDTGEIQRAYDDEGVLTYWA